MAFFSRKISTLSLVLIGYGFVLLCMCYVHLALLDQSVLDYVSQGFNNKNMAHPCLSTVMPQIVEKKL